METVLKSARESSQSVKLAYFCGAYVLAAILLIPQTYFSVFGQYPIQRYFLYIPPLIFIGLLSAAFICQPRLPLTFIRNKLATRGMGATYIVLVLIMSATAFTAFKHEYSKWVPFFADHFLADLDQAIHFGEPWRYARAIFPEAFEPLLFNLYAKLWFLEVVGAVLVAAFLENRYARERYFSTFVVTVIVLSSAVRIAGSSSGPIFYDRMFGGARFTDLIDTLRHSVSGPKVLEVSDYLYSSFATDTSVLGTGISAMPSFHVALAVLNAIFAASLSKWAGVFAWAYAAAIIFGSVYFGWHYALDDYVSIAAVIVIWRMFSKPDQKFSSR
jgi:hypothetical protein